MGQTGSSEPVTKVDNETSVDGVATYARFIGLGDWECFWLHWASYNGRALLTAREHQLRLDGLSAGGAAHLVHRLKRTRCQSNPLCTLASSDLLACATAPPTEVEVLIDTTGRWRCEGGLPTAHFRVAVRSPRAVAASMRE